MTKHVSHLHLFIQTLQKMPASNRHPFIRQLLWSGILGASMDVLMLLMPSYVLNLSEQTDRKILYICLYFLGLVLLQLIVNWISMQYEHLAFRFRYFQIPALAAVIMRKNTAYIDSTEGKEEIEQAYQAVFQGGNAGIEFYFIQWSNLFRALLSSVIGVVMIGMMGRSLWIIGVVMILCLLYMIYIRLQRKLETLKKEELQPKMMERYLTKTVFEENLFFY